MRLNREESAGCGFYSPTGKRQGGRGWRWFGIWGMVQFPLAAGIFCFRLFMTIVPRRERFSAKRGEKRGLGIKGDAGCFGREGLTEFGVNPRVMWGIPGSRFSFPGNRKELDKPEATGAFCHPTLSAKEAARMGYPECGDRRRWERWVRHRGVKFRSGVYRLRRVRSSDVTNWIPRMWLGARSLP